jgi:hypothetical protein
MAKQIEIKTGRVFEDYSGAPAVVTVDGFSFSFDRIGVTCCNLLTAGGRSPSKRVVALAEWRYAEYLKTLPAGWLGANAALYSETPGP